MNPNNNYIKWSLINLINIVIFSQLKHSSVLRYHKLFSFDYTELDKNLLKIEKSIGFVMLQMNKRIYD